MNIALATAAHLPNLSEDDAVLLAAMRARGLKAEPVIWENGADWAAYDVVVTRSIWDYHLKYERFLRWLDRLDEAGTRVFNPTSLQRWNSDKHYMLDLERSGINITPTRIVERGAAIPLADVLVDTGWPSAVVKPAVASTGYETWQLTGAPTAADAARFATQVAAMPVLVQEFVAGIRDGEQSFVFIGGDYSHCVLKKSATEDFRIHIEWGGTVERIEPAPALIDWARTVVAAVQEPWMYARVDAVIDARGNPVVMELEMLEPELFFAYEPAATDRFIDALNHAR